jgi:crotonobetainyl-CoA:carnitine CoA-transferase CaiB-like acyl-CoA transferase
MRLLASLRVVSTALNLPGPAACARLRDLGAAIAKVEPPSGDPLQAYSPAWYARLHRDVETHRLDLKADEGRGAMFALLEKADLLVTAQRPAALARLGLDPATLADRFPRLCHVAIVGHAPPDDGKPGHDLTYLAEHGLVSPPALPATLFADMAGAERVVSTGLALVLARDRGVRPQPQHVSLADAVAYLAQPLVEGMTRPGGLLGGGTPGYNLYAAKDGWIAVAALEPHFEKRLAQALGLPALSTNALVERFAGDSAAGWETWGRERDLPIVAVRRPDLP